MSKDAEIEIAVNNHYFFSNVFTDDLVVHTTDNTQRIHIGTLQDKEAALTINSNNLYANSNMYVARRLGVGKTSNAGYSLDVQGDIGLTGLLYKDGLPYSTGSSTWSSNNNNTITWYNNGVVGIGTSNPQSKFHIMGSNAGTNFNAMLLQNSNATGVALNFQDPQGTGSLRFNAGSLQLYAGNAEVAKTSSTNFIVSGGYLGVNATPARHLHVDGQSYFTSNVGIGTSNPAGLLDVGGSIFVGKGDDTESNTTNGIYFKGVRGDIQGVNSNYPHAGVVHRRYEPGKSELVLYSARSIQSNEGPDKIRMVGGAIQFQTYNSNIVESMLNTDYTPVETNTALSTALYINSNGCVGIGTAAPQSTLEVSGEASVTGDLMVTSNVRAYRLEMQGIVIKKNYGGETNFSPYTYPGISNENAGILSIFTPTELLRVYTNYSNEVMRIMDYQLGLNTPSNLDAYLKVQSTQDPLRLGDFVNLASNHTAEIRIRNDQSNGARLVLSQPIATAVLGIDDNGSNTYMWNSNPSADFTIGTGGQARITVKSDGRVGIGSSTPNAALYLQHDTQGLMVKTRTPGEDIFALQNYDETCFKVDGFGSVGLHTSNLFNVNTKLHIQSEETMFAHESNVVATTPVNASLYGQSVAVSADTKTLIVGAPSYGSNGTCFVYKQNGSNLVESALAGPTTGSNAQFGFSLSMNPGATRVIVGAPQYNTGSNLGGAFLYEYNAGTLQWDTNTVFLSTSNANSAFGYAVGMSSNGRVVAVGDPIGSGSTSVYRYNTQASNWDVHLLVGNSNSQNGSHIAVSDSGDVVAVGAPKGTVQSVADAGIAYVYRWNTLSNAYISDMVFPTVSYPSEAFGRYVSLSADGNRLAASGKSFNSTGRVVVFDFDGLSWNNVALLSNVDVSDSNYTTMNGPPSVKVFPNASNIAIGWRETSVGASSQQGRVTLYNWSGGAFNLDRTLTPYYALSNAKFGTSMAVSQDNTRIVVGAPNAQAGRVYTYDLVQQKVLTINNASSPILHVQSDSKVGVAVADPQAMLHVAGDVMFGKTGNSNTFVGGPFYKQASWDMASASHNIAYTEFGKGDNCAGTLYLQVSNKSTSNAKMGNATVSYIKASGANLDIFITNTHKIGAMNVFTISASNNALIVNTDTDCSVSWTSIGSH